MFFIVLLAVAFNHFKFVSSDKRNAYDFHAQCYGSLAVEYHHMLQNPDYVKGYEKIPVYAKLVGYVFYFFGKNYFTFRIVSLFFFLFYLGMLYLTVSILTKSHQIGIMTLCLHLLVPGIVFYSRLCWPHMWAACFTLIALVFLLNFLKDTRFKVLHFAVCVVCLGISVSMYYSSTIYVFLILVWMLLYNRKRILTKSCLLFFMTVFLPLVAVASYVFKSELVDLFIEFRTGNYFSIQALFEYRLLFISYLHYIFYFAFVFFALSYLILFKKNKGEVLNLFLFVLFFTFSVAASFLSYPTDVTVLGLSSACALIAWFIVKVLKSNIGAVITGIFFVLAVGVNFCPELFFLGAGDTLYAHKITLKPDTNEWGQKELRSWLLSVEKDKPKIALLDDTFYPLYGTNYVQPFDLQLLATEDIHVVWLDDSFFYENSKHSIYNKRMSLAADESEADFLKEIDSDTEIRKVPVERKLVEKDFDYLIFDDIKKPYPWFFVLTELIDCYALVLNNAQTESKEIIYREMRKAMEEKFEVNIRAFAFDVKARFRSLYRYVNLKYFFENSSFFVEEKRIECFGKDIIIYRCVQK